MPNVNNRCPFENPADEHTKFNLEDHEDRNYFSNTVQVFTTVLLKEQWRIQIVTGSSTGSSQNPISVNVLSEQARLSLFILY